MTALCTPTCKLRRLPVSKRMLEMWITKLRFVRSDKRIYKNETVFFHCFSLWIPLGLLLRCSKKGLKRNLLLESHFPFSGLRSLNRLNDCITRTFRWISLTSRKQKIAVILSADTSRAKNILGATHLLLTDVCTGAVLIAVIIHRTGLRTSPCASCRFTWKVDSTS